MALQARSEQAFRLFVSEANPSGLHERDAERWNAFVIALRLDGHRFGDVSGEVRRRLVEGGFPEDESEGESVDHLMGRLRDELWLPDMWAGQPRGG